MFRIEHHGRVARLTLARAPVNAINNEWLDGFGKILDGLDGREDVTVLHIRSDQKVFCAGADLNQVKGRFDMKDGPEVMKEDVRGFQTLYARIETLKLVTLAEIGGAAMGGGLELTLACDLRIAANEAKLGLPEVRLGLVPGAGGTQRLARLCGAGIANRIILGAEIVDGAEALALGIVEWAVPRAELEAAAKALAERISGLSGAAQAEAKSCIAAQRDPARDGFEEELETTRRLLRNAETRERVTAFLDGNLK